MDIDGDFKAAASDYLFLLDRQYPPKAALKLTGDRYRLSSDQRAILFRGIHPTDISCRIRRNLVSPEKLPRKNSNGRLGDMPRGFPKETKITPDLTLAVDGYNVLLTIMNYHLGRPVFLCTDGLIRDIGGMHGNVRNHGQLLREVMDVLVSYLRGFSFTKVAVYLDSPVSHSWDHAAYLGKKLGNLGSVILAHNADIPLQQMESGLTASSDSIVADRCKTRVWDLAFSILRDIRGFVPSLDFTKIHPQPER